MKRVLFLVPVVACVAFTAACSSDSDDDGQSSSSSSSSSSGAGSSSSSSGSSSGGSSSSSSSGSSSGGPACDDASFVFPADTAPALAPTEYASYLVVDAAFPFDVVGQYSTTYDVSSAAWDESGKLLAEDVDQDSGAITVHRLGAPAAATGALTDDPLTLAMPADVPAGSFADYPAVLSVAENQYVLGYTSTMVGGIVPGFAYLFEGAAEKSQSFSNGFFSIVGTAHGAGTRLYYSAFSPFAASQSNVSSSALYVSDYAGTDLGTATSFSLVFTGTDNSGPVVKDAEGNVAIASQGATVNLHLVSHCEAQSATATLENPVFHTYAESSTQSLAVVPATATLPGFVVQQSYGEGSAEGDSFATPFTRTGKAFATAGADVVKPLVWGPLTSGTTLLGDAQGNLWVAAVTNEGGQLLKLRRRR